MWIDGLTAFDLLRNACSLYLPLLELWIGPVNSGGVEILIVVGANVVELLVGSKLVPSSNASYIKRIVVAGVFTRLPPL